jgi:hypothetical protein
MTTRLVDLTGQQFGRLTVLKRVENNRWGAATWLCRCECGEEKKVLSNALRRGFTKSCWCLRREVSRDRKFLPNGEAAKNQIYLRYKLSAERRNLDWTLTEEQFFDLTFSNCRYCGCIPSTEKKLKSGSTFTYNGVDRRDSTKGYIESNVVPCCSTCNYAKRRLGEQEFISWIQQAAKNLSDNQLGERQ